MEIGNSFLIQHFMNAVWLIHPEKLKTMTEVILKKASSMDVSFINGSLGLLQFEKDKEKDKSDIVQIEGKIAILNIEGILVPKASWLDAMCGFMSTLEMHSQFNALVENNKIERIVLYIDSPGGELTGIPEFAESIFQARNKKEIVAFTDVAMASGAYWLSSAAEQLVVTPSSVIGSIGVYMSLIKEREDKKSFDVHVVQAGDNKLFGDSKIPVSDEEIAYFQERVNSNYKMFTESIAKYRDVDIEKVKDTKGGYYNSVNAPKWMYDTLENSKYVLE